MPLPAPDDFFFEQGSVLIPTPAIPSAVEGVINLEPLLAQGCPTSPTAASLVGLLAQNGHYAYEVPQGVVLSRTVGPISEDQDLQGAVSGLPSDPLRSRQSLSWHIRRVLGGPKTCQFLPPLSHGFMAGGCGMLAQVLHGMLGDQAQVAGLITSNKGLMHVLTLVDGAYIDADGIWTHDQAVTKNPMGPHRWIELGVTPDQMRSAGIKLPVRRTAALRAVLEGMGFADQIRSVLCAPSLEIEPAPPAHLRTFPPGV
jgi:hypothetical protein